jgi:hypothetical protein
MKNIPVDSTRTRILAAGNATPATNRDGTPRTNRDGKPLYNLPVLVLAEGSRAEATSIRLPGPVAPLPELAPLRFVGLVAWYWQMENGRSGISLTATEVQPDGPRVGGSPGAR